VIRLAFNSGESTGVANAWESMISTWPQETQNGEPSCLCKPPASAIPTCPNVPRVIGLRENRYGKKLVAGVINQLRRHRPALRRHSGTPKKPANRYLWRKAFMDTDERSRVRPPNSKRPKLDLNPLDGATLERNIQELFALDQSPDPEAK